MRNFGLRAFAATYSSLRGPINHGGKVATAGALPAGGFVPEQGRAFLQFTPGDIFAALLAADSGDIGKASDICTAMWGYGPILSATQTLVQSVTGGKVTFEDPQNRGKRRDGRRAGTVERALDEDYWLMEPETARFWMLWWRVMLGVSLSYNSWYEPDPKNPLGPEIARLRNRRNVPLVVVVHPRAMRRDPITRIWYVRDSDFNEWPILPGDPRWNLWTADADRPWLWGLWRALAILWIQATYAGDDWSSYLERYASAILAVFAPEGTDQPERDEMGRKLNEMARDPRIVFPFGYTASAIDMRGNGAQSFGDRIDNANRLIYITVLGGNLIADTTGGAATGAQLQTEVLQLRKDGYAEELGTWEQECGPPMHWTVMNFGDRNLTPFPIHHVAPPRNERQDAETRKLVAETEKIGRDAGIRVDDDVLERHNLRRVQLENGALSAPEFEEAA